MKYKIENAKKYLNDCINDLSKFAWLFSKNPGHDFTRNRKLPFSDMMKSIVCMSGGSLTSMNKEVCKCQ